MEVPMHNQRTLSQLRRLSWPIMMLVSFALGLLLLFELGAIASLLFFFHAGDSLHAAVGFSDAGLTLSIVRSSDPFHGLSLATLDAGQRMLIALLALACGACSALSLFHLRQLFALYARGTVFAAANIAHMKRFGLWLAVSAIAANIGARLFLTVTGYPPQQYANAAMALVYGAMIWAIARAMELGRLADAERNEFV
jgi:hypothetical protein